MGFSLTSPAPRKCDPTAKNRVWGFFGDARESHRGNRPQSLQPRQGNRPTTTKTVSGRTYWPSRDPLEENFATGEFNNYGMVKNDTAGKVDLLGLSVWVDLGTNIGGALGIDYNGAVADQGKKMEPDIDEINEETRNRRNAWLDFFEKLRKKPKPAPSPAGRQDAQCEYSCNLVSMGEISGIPYCEYSSCTFLRKISGSGTCPETDDGISYLAAKKDACGRFFCENPLIVTRSTEDDGTIEEGVTNDAYLPHAFGPFEVE